MKLENIYPSEAASEYLASILPAWLIELSESINIDIAQCQVEEGCNNGDIEIIYHTRESLVEMYVDSIFALDIENEAEENMYLKVEDIDQFKGALISRLEKTKLWNYPPDVRNDVKKARDFLKGFMQYDVTYGISMLVPASEAEAFMADEKNRFGIRSCKYHVVDKPVYTTINNLSQSSAAETARSTL